MLTQLDSPLTPSTQLDSPYGTDIHGTYGVASPTGASPTGGCTPMTQPMTQIESPYGTMHTQPTHKVGGTQRHLDRVVLGLTVMADSMADAIMGGGMHSVEKSVDESVDASVDAKSQCENYGHNQSQSRSRQGAEGEESESESEDEVSVRWYLKPVGLWIGRAPLERPPPACDEGCHGHPRTYLAAPIQFQCQTPPQFQCQTPP